MEPIETDEKFLSRLDKRGAFHLDENKSQRKLWTEKVIDYVEGFFSRLTDPSLRAQYSCDVAKEDEADPWTAPAEEGCNIDRLLETVKEKIEFSGIKLSNANYYGYTPNTGMYAAAIGALMAAVINVQSADHSSNQGASLLEKHLIDWTAQVIGFPETACGAFLPGGSSATVAAVACARDSMKLDCEDFDRAVIYTTSARHHCLDKALCVVGMREAPMRWVPVDINRKMDMNALRSMISMDREKGLIPFMISATFGSTDSGGVDPIETLADIAEKEKIWLHVDAAFGGYYYLLEEIRLKHRGFERADSVVLDPHKALNQPFGNGAVIVREGDKLKKSMSFDLLTQNDPEPYSAANYSFEDSRPFRALPMWFSLKLMGIGTFRLALQEKMELSRYCYEGLADLSDVIMGPYPELPCVTFRLCPEGITDDSKLNDITSELLADLNASGRVGMSSTIMDGHVFLRVVTNGYRTHLNHVKECVELIIKLSKKVADKYRIET